MFWRTFVKKIYGAFVMLHSSLRLRSNCKLSLMFFIGYIYIHTYIHIHRYTYNTYIYIYTNFECLLYWMIECQIYINNQRDMSLKQWYFESYESYIYLRIYRYFFNKQHAVFICLKHFLEALRRWKKVFWVSHSF